MTIWSRLAAELDLWRDAGRQATFWWRDDDACRDTPALQRLLAVAQDAKVPVALAVVPALLEPSLAAALAQADMATAIQHGYAHRNHAPHGARNWELGAHRPVDVMAAELESGRNDLERVFGRRFAPILVPPWNRIDDAVVERLPGSGFTGLSTFGPRQQLHPVAGVVQCNTHVDLIAWRRDRAFIGVEAAVDRLVAHLAARRVGTVAPEEPTGLLTHHLDFDATPWPAPWSFLSGLFARTKAHGTAAWIDARTAFAPVTSLR
jgi:hypothetical protein